jgi:hypothetical protein
MFLDQRTNFLTNHTVGSIGNIFQGYIRVAKAEMGGKGGCEISVPKWSPRPDSFVAWNAQLAIISNGSQDFLHPFRFKWLFESFRQNSPQGNIEVTGGTEVFGWNWKSFNDQWHRNNFNRLCIGSCLSRNNS